MVAALSIEISYDHLHLALVFNKTTRKINM